jgi:hypothetical protein
MYRVYAQKLPVERDGQSIRFDGSVEQQYKANLQYVGTVDVRPMHAIREAKKLTANPVIERAVLEHGDWSSSLGVFLSARDAQ